MLVHTKTGRIAADSRAWGNKIVEGFPVSPKHLHGMLMEHREVLKPRHKFSGKLFRLEERVVIRGLQ